MTRNELENMIKQGIIKQSHTSFIKYYVSRKIENLPQPQPYKGKFGKGFIVLNPCYKSTRYSYITYYIFVKGD